jgi:antitoxin ParD1/3/4/toxin ParE1/3/4
MNRFIVAPEAEDDLLGLWRYLVETADFIVADRVQDELLDSFEAIARTPGLGHRRQDLTWRNVFFHRIYQYMIVYRKGDPVEIIAVLHGKRDIKRNLRARLGGS